MEGELQNIKQKIDSIYNLIAGEIIDFKNRDPQEIDYSFHYEDLKEIFQYLVKYNKTLLVTDIKIRYLFFAFSIEIFNNQNYHSSFWETLFSEIHSDNSIYHTCFNSLIKTTGEIRFKIRLSGDGKRLLIYSLKGKSIRDIRIWELICEFFLTYFKFHKNDPIEHYFKIFAKSANYSPFYEEKEDIIEYVAHATDVFTRLIEEQNEFIDNENFIRSYLKDEGLSLGPFRNKRISSIIRELSNRMTPLEFKKFLKTHLNSEITNPEKQRMPVRQFLITSIDFGDYFFDSCKFEVTPNHRIGIREMVQWEEMRVIDYKGLSYYKKSIPFEVTNQEVRRCVTDDIIFFVWCGVIPIGKGIQIDTIFERREGFFWDPKFKMVYGSEDNPPAIIIETGNIIFFGKFDNGKRLTVKIGNKIYEDIIGIDGYFSHSYVYSLENNIKSFYLCSMLDNQLIREKTLNLDDHILFSNNTREQLKSQREHSNIVSKRFGEAKYTLFTKYNPDVLHHHLQMNNCQINENNDIFQQYYVYEIEWYNEKEFELKIDDFIWKFQIKKEIHLYFADSLNIFTDLKQFDLIIDIMNPSNRDDIIYQIFDNSYQSITVPIPIEENLFSNGIYHLTGDELIENSLGHTLDAGEYYIEVACGEDIATRHPFFLIPPIFINWPLALPENEAVSIEFKSPEKVFIDAMSGEPTNILFQTLIGNIISTNLFEQLSIIPEKKEISIPLATPRITYPINVPDIPIFGFRLFEIKETKNNQKLQKIHRHELNYYDLSESYILLFSKQHDILTLTQNNAVLANFTINSDNSILIEPLKHLQQHSNKNINDFFITSLDSYKKKFVVYWNPKILHIFCDLELENQLHLNINLKYNGPQDSKIRIIVSSHLQKIKEIEIFCQGHEVLFEKSILIDKFKEEIIFFIQTYIFTYNNEWVPSKQITLYNELAYKIIVKTGKTFEISKEISYFLFLKDIFSDEYAKKIVEHPYPILIELLTGSETTNLMEKILLHFYKKCPNLHFLIIKNSEFARFFKMMNPHFVNNTRIHYIESAEEQFINEFNRIFNPYPIQQLTRKGIAVSNLEIWNEIMRYIPNIFNFMIFEYQKIRSDEIDKIIQLNIEAHFVVIRR